MNPPPIIVPPLAMDFPQTAEFHTTGSKALAYRPITWCDCFGHGVCRHRVVAGREVSTGAHCKAHAQETLE